MPDVTKTLGLDLNGPAKPKTGVGSRKKPAASFASHLATAGAEEKTQPKPQRPKAASKAAQEPSEPQPREHRKVRTEETPAKPKLQQNAAQGRETEASETPPPDETQVTEQQAAGAEETSSSAQPSAASEEDDNNDDETPDSAQATLSALNPVEPKPANASATEKQEQLPAPPPQSEKNQNQVPAEDASAIERLRAGSSTPQPAASGNGKGKSTKAEQTEEVPEGGEADPKETVHHAAPSDLEQQSATSGSQSAQQIPPDEQAAKGKSHPSEERHASAKSAHQALHEISTQIQALNSAPPSAPPKPTEAGQNNNTNVPVPYAVLPVEIGMRSLGGQKEISIDLSPQELGQVNVTIGVDALAQTQVNFVVDQPQTLALLKQDASHIRHALEQAGVHVPEAGLSFNLSQDNQANSGFSGQGKHQGHQAGPPAPMDQSINWKAPETFPNAPYRRVHLNHLDLSV